MTRRSLISHGLLWIVLALTALSCRSSESDGEIARVIRQRVGPAGWFQKRATVDDDDIQPLVRRFYRNRKYLPAWTHIDGPTRDAGALLEALTNARAEGLNPAQYDVERLQQAIEKSGAPGLPTEARTAQAAALDIELTRNFLKHAAHLYSGQVNPVQLPADWHIKPRRRDMVEVLEHAISRHQVESSLESLTPGFPQYEELRKALADYRRIEAEGGWPRIPSGATLRRGGSGARVDSLQRRLTVTRDLGGRYRAGQFDAATEAALERFEARHGLESDGVAGPEDLRALNLPVTHRIRQIELNMERWRWLPDSLLGDRYLMVNIPNYSLQVVENDRTVLAMRVVVGKEFSRTPMFTDEVSYMVFNPVWNVPSSIASQEILAEVQQDPEYLRRNNIRVFENESDRAVEVDPQQIDWGSMSPEDFHYNFRQDPGPENPVGHVKFMCPNQFNVYLHDTPANQLFAARERGFSHGCIRVEKPIDLAAYLMKDEGWDDARVVQEFGTADNTSVKVPSPIPVHIFYWTAFTDENGALQFREDVYDFDHLLDNVLRSRRPDIKTPVRAAITPTVVES